MLHYIRGIYYTFFSQKVLIIVQSLLLTARVISNIAAKRFMIFSVQRNLGFLGIRAVFCWVFFSMAREQDVPAKVMHQIFIDTVAQTVISG